MTYILVWGWGKQARKTRLHCTCRAPPAHTWSGKSTPGGGQACRSALDGGGWASGGCSRYREYVQTMWIPGEHGAMRVQHRQPWCWHRCVFTISCDPAVSVACQEGNNHQVRCLDSHTKSRHAAWDDVGQYTLGNLPAMELKPVFNAQSCHLHTERCNTHPQRWNCV